MRIQKIKGHTYIHRKNMNVENFLKMEKRH